MNGALSRAIRAYTGEEDRAKKAALVWRQLQAMNERRAEREADRELRERGMDISRGHLDVSRRRAEWAEGEPERRRTREEEEYKREGPERRWGKTMDLVRADQPDVAQAFAAEDDPRFAAGVEPGQPVPGMIPRLRGERRPDTITEPELQFRDKPYSPGSYANLIRAAGAEVIRTDPKHRAAVEKMLGNLGIDMELPVGPTPTEEVKMAGAEALTGLREARTKAVPSEIAYREARTALTKEQTQHIDWVEKNRDKMTAAQIRAMNSLISVRGLTEEQKRQQIDQAELLLPIVRATAEATLKGKQLLNMGAITEAQRAGTIARLMSAYTNAALYGDRDKAGNLTGDWKTMGDDALATIVSLQEAPVRGKVKAPGVPLTATQKLHRVLSWAKQKKPQLYDAIIRARRQLSSEQLLAEWGHDKDIQAALKAAGVE